MSVYIILLGPPGAGKGTQAKVISEKMGLSHISSGDIFRENIKNGTDLGKLANSYMVKGELVPDDVTIAMISERLSRSDCQPGALLDGFPRTTAQAAALDEALDKLGGKVNAVPYINVPEAVLVERLTGRWTCRESGHIYHEKYNPPKEAGKCDIDGSDLYQRSDDVAETVIRRIRVYLEQTAPLIAYYRQQGTLLELDGALAIEQVSADLLAGLAERL
ncbi:MAG: adenylate kinase [Anaerolineales bacterium]|nr:adenylate kinase [Anaerolineales bacterium]